MLLIQEYLASIYKSIELGYTVEKVGFGWAYLKGTHNIKLTVFLDLVFG